MYRKFGKIWTCCFVRNASRQTDMLIEILGTLLGGEVIMEMYCIRQMNTRCMVLMRSSALSRQDTGSEQVIRSHPYTSTVFQTCLFWAQWQATASLRLTGARMDSTNRSHVWREHPGQFMSVGYGFRQALRARLWSSNRRAHTIW